MAIEGINPGVSAPVSNYVPPAAEPTSQPQPAEQPAAPEVDTGATGSSAPAGVENAIVDTYA